MEGEANRSDRMDYSDLAKIVTSRIQKFEPENVAKIMGCILLKEPGVQEMIQLALGPETALLWKIADAKVMLDMLSPKNPIPVMQFGSYPPSGGRSFPSPVNFHVQASPNWSHHLASQHPAGHTLDSLQRTYADSVSLDYLHRDQLQLLGMNEQPDVGNNMSFNNSNSPINGSLEFRPSRRSHSMSELSVKTCHYFNKGVCKHGANCKYHHAKPFPDGNSLVFASDMTEFGQDDYEHRPRPLLKLEREIVELLKSKRGLPVSIASLPMLYFEKYGKHLQDEGYLSESQMLGTTGLSLSNLLSRLKNSIRVIERQDGQHSVILAEDAPRYLDGRYNRNDSGATHSSSHQIYLTFPAESTFTEDDVSNYFKQFGQVRDVRIPCQEKRMFGFVSFVNPDTVSTILMKKNPHYICGDRVLVKPYKEKSRMMERSYTEKIKPRAYHPTHYLDMDPDVRAVARESETSRLLKLQAVEEQEKMLELQRMRLSELNMAPKTMTQQTYMQHLHGDFYMDHFSRALDAFNNSSVIHDETRNASNDNGDQDSDHVELPDSPFNYLM